MMSRLSVCMSWQMRVSSKRSASGVSANNSFINSLEASLSGYTMARAAIPNSSERVKILSSETSYSYLKPFYSECMEHHEESYVMFLNRANKALGVSLISKGGMSETVMDVKIILQTALKVHASGIILSHNHPSGNLHPSEPDKKITTKINEACKVLDLHLLDHIILTEESYYSFADEGLI